MKPERKFKMDCFHHGLKLWCRCNDRNWIIMQLWWKKQRKFLLRMVKQQQYCSWGRQFWNQILNCRSFEEEYQNNQIIKIGKKIYKWMRMQQLQMKSVRTHSCFELKAVWTKASLVERGGIATTPFCWWSGCGYLALM